MINKRLIIIVSIALFLVITIAFTLAYEEKIKDSTTITEEKNDEASPQDAFLGYLEQQVENLPADEKQEFEQHFSNNPEKAFLEIIDKLKS